MKPPRPLLWVGAKQQAQASILLLIESWIEALPADIEAGGWGYCEPFLGGGSIYLAAEKVKRLDRKGGVQIVLADLNAQLVAAWRGMAEWGPDIANALRELHVIPYGKLVQMLNAPSPLGEEATTQETEEWVQEQAAVFFAVNRLCFNGLYRVNSKGEFNTPPGSRAKEAAKHLHLCATEIEEAYSIMMAGPNAIFARDYRETLAKLDPQTPWLIYMDPPYMDTYDQYVVNGNASPGWTAQLFRWVNNLALPAGSRVIVSNAIEALPLVPRGWNFKNFIRSGKMNSDTSKRGGVAEIIAWKDWT